MMRWWHACVTHVVSTEIHTQGYRMRGVREKPFVRYICQYSNPATATARGVMGGGEVKHTAFQALLYL